MITVPRRGFIMGLGALMAAPVIVRATSLMKVRAIPDVASWPLAQRILPDLNVWGYPETYGVTTVTVTDQLGNHITDTIIMADPRSLARSYAVAMRRRPGNRLSLQFEPLNIRWKRIAHPPDEGSHKDCRPTR